MIPLFPHFTPLALELKDEIQAITAHYPSYSDYGFTSMWSYDTESSARICLLNQNLVLRYGDYITGDYFYSFLGAAEIDATAKTLIAYAAEHKMDTTLKLIPQIVIDHFKHPEHFVISEDRDNFDYILSVPELVAMHGPHYQNKRNLVRRFLRAYEHEMKTKPLELSDATVRDEIIQTFHDWAASRNKSSEEIAVELEAIKRMLNDHDKFDLNTIGIFINNRLRGFSIFEFVHDGHGVVHYEKADVGFEGIFYYLKQQAAVAMHSNGVSHLNYMQDLG
ncbi:MAG TPA: phosphatidylglycerol lysyltransferase domain-containing protein, partial [Candidatus Saccharimonadia bacterium]